MSEKTLKIDNVGVSKKEFHKSNQPIDFDLVNADQIVVSDKFKHSHDGFKHSIGYKEGETVKPLCITSNDWMHKILSKWWQKHVFCNQK